MALKCCILGGLLAVAVPLAAHAGELLAPEQASRVGLVQSWQRQLRLSGGAQSVVDIQIHVQADRQRQLISVVQQVDGTTETLLRIPVDQLDHLGQPIGIDEAKRQAAMEVRRFARRGIEAVVVEEAVPEVRLYTLTTDGTVEARDAETGRLLWVTRHGNARMPYGSLGVHDRFITFVNGSTLFQLSSDDGQLIASTRTQATPTLGTSIVGPYVMVPTLRGAVEGYPLEDVDSYPFMERVDGRATAEPVAPRGSTRAAWPTEHRFVYVMETEGSPSVLFRMNTDGVVTSPVIAAADASGDLFFFASDSGQVYGVRASRSGQVLWRQSLGQPIFSPLFRSGQRLLVRSVYGNLFCLNLADGAYAWSSPARQVEEVLCVVGNRIFVRTAALHVAVLNLETGAMVDAISDVTAQHYLVNDQTDRLYLLSSGGAMQCLRPINAELPSLLVPLPVAPQEGEAEATAAEAAEPSEPAAETPFGTSPFGGFGQPAAGEEATGDPFGGDPFGGN